MSRAPDLLSDPAALSQVLGMLGASASETIKQGEKLLKTLNKQPMCLMAYLQQIRQASSDGVRFQAALMLKKKMVTHFKKLDNQSKESMKSEILMILQAEPAKVVATAIAGAVATLTKAIFSLGGNWSELLNSLTVLSQSQQDSQRSLCFSLLEQLAETVAENLKPLTGTLVQMFTAGCQDASPTVSVAAMKATGAFLKEMIRSKEVMQLKPMLTPVLQVLVGCLTRGEEDTVREGLDLIQECLLAEQPLVNDHLADIVKLVMQILSTDDLDMSIKQSAGQTLIGIVENRPKAVAKLQLVTPVLTVLAGMIAKSEAKSAGALFSFSEQNGRLDQQDDDDDDASFEEEMDLQQLAQACVDCMAINIPSKHFVQPALELCAQGMQSPEPQMRKAGCALLGIIAEGCSDAIRASLQMIVPPLLTSMQDNEYYVREVATFAVGQFAEHCQPEILHFHQTVLPVVFRALDDPKDTVQGTSCYVIENFCENLKPETLKPFLGEVLSKLGGMLSSPKLVNQEMALSAIAATAVASEKEFLPFAEGLCTALAQKLFTDDEKQFGVRGRALECLGHLAVGLEGEHFARYFPTGMQSAMQAIQMDNEGLKEYSYLFAANTAKVMGPALEPYLAELTPHLLTVINETEIVFNDPNEDEDEDEDYEDDENADEGGIQINGDVGFINNKKAAITAIGALARHTKQLFFPYLEGAMKALLLEDIGPLNSYHDEIRGESLEIMCMIVTCACHDVTKPAPSQMATLNPMQAEVVRVCALKCIAALEDDASKSPAAQAAESLTEILDTVGVVVLGMADANGVKFGERILNSILAYLQGKADCQLAAKADGDEEDDEEDHDREVMDSVTDLLSAMARALGPAFVAYFDTLLPPLMDFMKEHRIFSDRAMALGTFAEVMEVVGPQAAKYVDIALPMIQTCVMDPHEGVRRNAAYLVGCLATSLGEAFVPHFLTVLQWLSPLCVNQQGRDASDTGGADADNAISAVAKMIKVSPSTIPLNMVLPVMIAALPLRDDQEEGKYVYGCLVDLLAASNAEAISMYPQILSVLGRELSVQSKSDDETKAIVLSGVKSLAATPATQAAFAAALEQVSADLQTGIKEALQA